MTRSSMEIENDDSHCIEMYQNKRDFAFCMNKLSWRSIYCSLNAVQNCLKRFQRRFINISLPKAVKYEKWIKVSFTMPQSIVKNWLKMNK